MTCFVYTNQSTLNWKQENNEFGSNVEGKWRKVKTEGEKKLRGGEREG